MSQKIFINQKKVIVDVSIYELNELQMNLKKTTDDAYQKFRKHVLKEGFKYVFFYWENENGEKYIIDGHHRKKFLLKMQDEGIEIPEFYPALPIEAKNKKNAVVELLFLNSHYGQITKSGLRELITHYKIIPLELKQTHIQQTHVSLTTILDDMEKEVFPITNGDDCVNTIKKSITKTGDVWELGEHKLLCGDSTNHEYHTRLLKNQIASICFTSPPYNTACDIKHSRNSKYITGTDNMDNYSSFLQKFITVTLPYCDYLFLNIGLVQNNKIDLIDFLYHLRNHFVDVIIWKKKTSCPAMQEYILNSDFEFLFIFSKKENPPRMIKSEKYFRGTVSNVYEGGRNNFNEYTKIHTAIFPVDLPTHFIENFTNKGSIILDPFAGLGSALIACCKTGRICYLIELSGFYCDCIVARWIQWKQKNDQEIVKLTLNDKPINPDNFLS